MPAFMPNRSRLPSRANAASTLRKLANGLPLSGSVRNRRMSSRVASTSQTVKVCPALVMSRHSTAPAADPANSAASPTKPRRMLLVLDIPAHFVLLEQTASFIHLVKGRVDAKAQIGRKLQPQLFADAPPQFTFVAGQQRHDILSPVTAQRQDIGGRDLQIG